MQLLTKKIETKFTSGDWETIKRYIQEQFNGITAGTFVIMHNGVCMGSFTKEDFVMPGKLPLEPEYLRSIRVFDANKECYVWRSSMDESGIFRFRLIQDKEINEDDGKTGGNIVEARQLLWGTSLETSPGNEEWAVLKENRGIELLIHRSLLPQNVEVSAENRLWLITHNYINYTPLGQAEYVDCRFVRIEDERRRGE